MATNEHQFLERVREEVLRSVSPVITQLKEGQASLQTQLTERYLDQPPRVKPAKPDVFNPDIRGVDLNLWIFQLETYMAFVKMPEDQKVDYASTLLRGAAISWWRNHVSLMDEDEDWNSWDVFVVKIKKQFQPINPVKIARDRLANLRQRTSVQEYTQRFYAITLDIPNITEEECIDKYIRGLKPRVAKEIELRGLNVLEDIVVAAQRYDSIDFRMSLRDRASSNHYGSKSGISSYRKHSSNSGPMDIDSIMPSENSDSKKRHHGVPPKKLTEEDKAIMRKEGRCYYCRKTGHLAISCPNKKLPKNEKSG